MASSFSNLLNGSGYKPLNIALNNKANPPLITPPKMQLPSVGTTQPQKAAIPIHQPNAGNAFTPGALQSSVAAKQTPVSKPEMKNPTDTGVSGEHLAGLIKITQGLQKSAETLAAKQKEDLGGNVTPEKLGTGVQGELIQNALAKQKEASEFNQLVGQSEENVKHNPNYSLDTGIGLAGNIAATQGLKAQALTAQAGQAATLAGMTSPISALNAPVDPLTGRAISSNPAGAAFSAGQTQGQVSAGQDYTARQSANTAAKGIASNITSQLSQFPELNASPVALGNALTQWINKGIAPNPKYQNLFNAISEYMQTLAPILGIGGGSTDYKTRLATDFIDPLMSGQGITQVLQATEKLADDKIANLKSGALGGGVTSGSSSIPGVASTSVGEFVQDESGKWVKK